MTRGQDTIVALMDEIGVWHRSVFGSYSPINHVKAIAQKAQEEAMEVYDNPCEEEIADLLICALAMAERFHLDPAAIVRRKLVILRTRGMSQLDRDKERGIVQAKDVLPAESGE